MTTNHRPVPPTPFYYGKRAELFLHDAETALLRGDLTRYNQLMLRATQYAELAGQLPLERGLYVPTDPQDSEVLEVRHGIGNSGIG